jgi:Ca2+-binding EF-hand superfamily protein
MHVCTHEQGDGFGINNRCCCNKGFTYDEKAEACVEKVDLEEKYPDIYTLFKEFDVDPEDGLLSPKEFKALIEDKAPSHDVSEFEVADADKNKGVDFPEFVSFWKKITETDEDLEKEYPDIFTLFKEYDVDPEDGLLNTEEFTALMDDTAPSHASEFESADADKNKGVDFSEFVSFWKKITEDFRHFDTDEDGVLSQSEFDAFVKEKLPDGTKPDFALADTDGSGGIDFQEFMKYWSKMLEEEKNAEEKEEEDEKKEEEKKEEKEEEEASTTAEASTTSTTAEASTTAAAVSTTTAIEVTTTAAPATTSEAEAEGDGEAESIEEADVASEVSNGAATAAGEAAAAAEDAAAQVAKAAAGEAVEEKKVPEEPETNPMRKMSKADVAETLP